MICVCALVSAAWPDGGCPGMVPELLGTVRAVFLGT